MLSSQLRSAVIVLIVMALIFSTVQAQVERSCRTATTGILTDRLSAKQLSLWRKVERIVFAEDAEGQILYPVLHALWRQVETSGHSIQLEISEEESSYTAGFFRLEQFDPTGQHHLAVIGLRPRVIDHAYVGPCATRLDGLIPFAGLRKEERYAEVLGHELAHATDILLNLERARLVEELVVQTNELLLSPRKQRGASIGLELNQRIIERDSLLQRLETYPEMMETRIWRELRAAQPAWKRP